MPLNRTALSDTTTVTKPRAAANYRVSSEEQVEGYSLAAQARAAKLYCELHCLDLVREYRDEGKSARSEDLSKRPAFAQMLVDAEAGHFSLIVVHKLDRYARNLGVLLDTIKRLDRVGVGVTSVSENIDYSSPTGRLFLHLLGGFAQYYSDNLSHETKKGKEERKRQGLPNGLLPFGIKKGADGVPVPDPETYPGLLLAFKAAAGGRSDREVAQLLNEHGYRTTGNRGRNLFSKDSVRVLLRNRFYLGELPDGEGGWLRANHAPMLDNTLFDAAQAARLENKRHLGTRVPSTAQTYSLSGLGVCGYCRGKLHIHRDRRDRPRIYCYRGRQGEKCAQRESFLDVFEDQLADYLATFQLPPDYREQIMGLYAEASAERIDQSIRRKQIESRLARLKEMYSWGDIERDAYQRERDALTAELASMRDAEDRSAILEQTAALLADLRAAWAKATQEQRNRLAQMLFAEVEIKDNRVESVVPQPDFAGFFVLDAQLRASRFDSKWRKRRDSNPRSQP